MTIRLGRDAATGPVTVLAYVDRYPPMVNAGAEWMLHAMLRDSVARGHRVIVATPCCTEATTFDGVEVYPTAAGLAEAANAELVVGHLLFTREAVRYCRERGLPLLYVLHNDSQLRWWRLGRDDVSALVWNSEWIGRHGRTYRDVAGVPGTTVRPPLDCGSYTDPRFPAPGSREFVTLVNPIEAKGAGVFYALARRMPERRFLAVEGAYGSQRRPSATDRNVEWQRQTGTIAADVLARTRVLLMPSSYESWGRAAVEALCSGIPVVASPTPGLTEALGDAGIYVDPADIDGWRAAVARLDDPETYATWSGRALTRAGELEEIARLDLERWDRLIRLAAGATRVRSGSMATTPYDPFRGGAPLGAPQPTATPPPVAAQERQEAIGPDGGPESPGGQEAAQEAPIRAEEWAVPDKAIDIVHALATTTDPAEARQRAELVRDAEAQRDEPRKSVAAAVAKILG